MHILKRLKTLGVFLTPHFRMGLFIYTPPTRYREEEFRLLQPGEDVVLHRTQKLAEVEYLAFMGLVLFPSIKSVYRRNRTGPSV